MARYDDLTVTTKIDMDGKAREMETKIRSKATQNMATWSQLTFYEAIELAMEQELVDVWCGVDILRRRLGLPPAAAAVATRRGRR